MKNSYHVLIVEDEEQWREGILREALEDAGYRVQTCSSYSEAMAVLDRQNFDLVVIDVNLTGVAGNQDGIRLLEYLASHKDRRLVIMISGSKTRAMAEESVKKFKPLAFVDKTTFDISKFITLVSDALDKA